MKKILIVFSALSIVLVGSTAIAKKIQKIRAEGGVPVPQLGVVIDASYDPRLDTLVPGYKVINVALFNQSLNIVYLNPEKDLWKIKLDGNKRSYPAMHDLRQQAPQTWAALPERVKTAIAYPLVLAVGAQQIIDIFVPEDLDLTKFTELSVFFKNANTQVDVIARQ